MVDASGRRDIKDASVYEGNQFYIPKVYQKLYYSIECAIHSKIVRVRSKEGRKMRYPTKKRKTRAQLREQFEAANMKV